MQAQLNFEGQYLDKITRQLGVFKDKDGLLRCKGRLNNSILDPDARNPILIPRNHSLENLIMRSHGNMLRNGVKEAMMDLRSRFWIVKGRQLVKRNVHACKLCSRIQGLSYGHPETRKMPDFRAKEDLAFLSIEIDFAGTFFIKRNLKPCRKCISHYLHVQQVEHFTWKLFPT